MTELPLRVPVSGGDLVGVRSGAGRPLLVLHGGPGLSDYSDWFAGELAGWDALRYTQRGVDPSVTSGPFTIEQHVADALAVLDRHEVAAATVLGSSWGGYLGMQLAARAPERVSALVLADTLGPVGDGGLAEFGAELSARAPAATRARIAELAAIEEAAGDNDPAGVAAALEAFRLIWPCYLAVPAAAPAFPATMRRSRACYRQTFASVADAERDGRFPGRLARFAGPVEVIAGEFSPFPAHVAQATAAAFPAARLTLAAGGGHLFWHECPGYLAAALSRVAARLP